MAAVQERTIALTSVPEPVHFPVTHYIFIEKRGDIPVHAQQAWSELQSKVPAIMQNNTILGFLSLYKMKDGIYRAGVSVAAPPKSLPDGLTYQKFVGGKYRKFVLRGPYTQLAEACGMAFKMIIDSGTRLRDDFGIERYVNDPQTTPEDQLTTEILFPIE